MAKKVLVVEPDQLLTQMIRDILEEEEEYTVITAKDGPEGLRKARREQPDLVIVDFKLPSMSGNDVCRRLRRDPATDHQKILMLAEESQLEDLVIGSNASADDFLIKPFSNLELVTKIKPLLFSEEEETKTISTGNSELDGKMGGGIPLGSLTLIEGDSGAGKSVLAQQMMHGSLEDGYTLTLFSSENTVKSLVKQMRSLSLDVLDYLLLDKLRVYPIETSGLGRDAPPTLMKAIRQEAAVRDMIFVDSLTSSIPQSSDKEVLAFFESCKRLCGSGTTIVIVVHSHGLSRELLTRLRSLCDAHLRLRTEEIGQKLVKTLEVTKVRGAEKSTGNIISFEVEPGWGMRVIPINKVGG